MAEIKISALTTGTPKGTDETPAVDTTDTTQAASGTTKKYIRSSELNYYLGAQGLITYTATRVATTVALTVTYANGVLGVGATLTNAGAQAALNIDGVALAVSDRVLVKNQAATAQNGIYTVTNIGSGSTNWVMTRATDYDQAAEIIQYAVVLSNQGTLNAGLLWQETGAGPWTIGTTAIIFSQYVVGSGGSVNAGLVNQLAYYAASGSTLSGLATANDGVLVTSAGGVPSISSTLPSGLTIPGYALSSSVVLLAPAGHQTITVGNLVTSNGGLQSGVGAGGFDGYVQCYPTTASSGSLVLQSVTNSSGNFHTIVANASAIGQTQTISIPDSGAASAGFLLTASGTSKSINYQLTMPSIAFSSTSGIIGTTTNDNAAAGSVGEYTSATQGTPQALTTTVALTITSVSLTAGDWDVWGAVLFVGAATTNVVQESSAISLTNNAIDDDYSSVQLKNSAAGVVQDGINVFSTPARRVSIAGTTNVYLVASGVFSVDTLSAYGQIKARRVR